MNPLGQFIDEHILQVLPVVELTSDTQNPRRVVRQLAFDNPSGGPHR